MSALSNISLEVVKVANGKKVKFTVNGNINWSQVSGDGWWYLDIGITEVDDFTDTMGSEPFTMHKSNMDLLKDEFVKMWQTRKYRPEDNQTTSFEQSFILLRKNSRNELGEEEYKAHVWLEHKPVAKPPTYGPASSNMVRIKI